MGVFTPFECYAWPSSEDFKKDPVGATKEEAEFVGWLGTCAAYINPRDINDTAKNLAYLIHLRRDGLVVERLHKRLSSSSSDLLDLRDVEKELQSRLQEVDVEFGGIPRRIDPYFFSS